MGKTSELKAAQIFKQLVSKRTKYRSDGKNRSGSRLEVTMWSAIAAAVKGNVEAAELLLHMHDHADRYGEFEPELVYVRKTASEAAKQKGRKEGGSIQTAKQKKPNVKKTKHTGKH